MNRFYKRNKSKKRNPFFNDLSSVMDGVSKNLGLEKGLKISSFAKLWPKMVGPRFENTSKMYSITQTNGADTITVATSSAVVANELSMFKNDILKKLNQIGKNFGFDIQEVKFSTKIWKEEEQQQSEKQEIKISEADLEKIKINEDVLASIRVSIDDKDESVKEKFFKAIVKDLKKQIWLKENNYAVCANCGVPLSISEQRGQDLCPSCRYAN